MFSVKESKKEALSALRGRWQSAVLLTLVVSLITAALSLPTIMLGAGNQFNAMLDQMDAGGFDFSAMVSVYRQIFSAQLFEWALNILVFVISGAISIAAARFYLSLSSNPAQTNFGTFIEGLTYWGKGILAALWMSLWIWLWCMLFFGILLVLTIVCAAAGAAGGGFEQIFSYNYFDGVPEWSGGGAFAVFGIALFVWGAAFAVVLVNRTIAYSQMLFIQAEYPDVSVSKTLKASIAMTKGCRAKLFLLDLSFIGWIALTALTLGIGYLWLAPYMSTTHAVVYRRLKANAFEKGIFATAQPAPVTVFQENQA